MKWFGKTWGAAICQPTEKIDVPVGVACVACGRTFIEESRGLCDTDVMGGPFSPMHLRCLMSACTPSVPCQRSMLVAQNVFKRAAELLGDPAKLAKMPNDQALEHVRANHVRAMREITVASPKSAILGIARPTDNVQAFSEAKAREIAELSITKGDGENAFVFIVERLMALVADEIDLIAQAAADRLAAQRAATAEKASEPKVTLA